MSAEELKKTKDLANEVYNEQDTEVRIERIREYCKDFLLKDAQGFGVAYSNEISAIMSSQFGFEGTNMTNHVENGVSVSVFLYGKKAINWVNNNN